MFRDFMICRSEGHSTNGGRDSFAMFEGFEFDWCRTELGSGRGFFFLLRTCRLSASVWISHPSRNSDRVTFKSMLLEKCYLKNWIQKCRKKCGLGCVNRARAKARVTQPTPHIFLHICTTLWWATYNFVLYIFNYVKKLRESLTRDIIFSRLLSTMLG